MTGSAAVHGERARRWLSALVVAAGCYVLFLSFNYYGRLAIPRHRIETGWFILAALAVATLLAALVGPARTQSRILLGASSVAAGIFVALVGAGVAILLAESYLREHEQSRGEFSPWCCSPPWAC